MTKTINLINKSKDFKEEYLQKYPNARGGFTDTITSSNNVYTPTPMRYENKDYSPIGTTNRLGL